MKLGVTGNFVWFGPKVTELAKAIEDFGFESMWMGEHPVIPVAAANAVRYGVPLPENYRHMPDPFVSLAAAAAVTEKLAARYQRHRGSSARPEFRSPSRSRRSIAFRVGG